MTLRVTFEIIPHGEEDHKYSIGILELHNISSESFGLTTYNGKYTSGEKEILIPELHHQRQNGFLELTRKAIKYIDNPPSNT